MSQKQAVKWILPISLANKDLLKSISVCTNTPMYELGERAIFEFIERIREGDYQHNLSEMKRKRNEYLKLKKMLAEMARIKVQYADTMQHLGIEELAAKTLT